ncbi:MAG: aminotransferase class I/II-fold pyridoxal phosphate-dependent enzyme [Candidatus Buchananbacteria bacterium]|nr:aminotransferase class I/II-fold pyridoxal phosphate-dependent enzyme [Candidatus Buchananbacteria bacterium]
MQKKSKLAIFGAKKTITTKKTHFTWPQINQSIEKRVIKQLHTNISIYDRSGIFEKFENDYSKYHKIKYSLLCSSGTLAIHSMFVAANLKPGDEVICPAYTFFATVTPLLFTGAIPVLCDCDQNGNISPQEIKKLITKKTKAIIITHMWGIPCQMDKITKICKKNKILLLEDCSHAHGAQFKNKLVGSFGDLAAWSLQGAKIVTGGEGGIMATNNKQYYYRALLLGHYNKRCKQEIPQNHPYYNYAITGMGLKYRAHPLAVAIASEIFKKLDSILNIKNDYAQKMIKTFNKLPGITPPQITNKEKPAWYALTAQYKSNELNNLNLDIFFKALHAEGLKEFDNPSSTKPLNLLTLFQKPENLFPIYKKYKFSYKKNQFPNALKFYKNAIKLPVWTSPKDKLIFKAYMTGLKKVINNYQDLL